MSESKASQKRSDFSIERILSDDTIPSSTKCFNKRKISCSNFQSDDELNEERLQMSDSDLQLNKNDILWINPYKMQNQDSKISTDTNCTVNGECNQTITNGNKNELSWLKCTRYRPPRLPRKSSTGKGNKRRLGSHPRIPFTKFQLQILEEKYRINAYLSRRDVIHLSGVLHLPQSRVKIWFQNRRARERKESQ